MRCIDGDHLLGKVSLDTSSSSIFDVAFRGHITLMLETRVQLHFEEYILRGLYI
jgi:hypothetical protein